MTHDQVVASIVLAFVAAQRVCELVIARRNTSALLATGGVEVGRGHYPIIVAVHVAWLVGLAGWIAKGTLAIATPWLAIYAVLQVARLWVMMSLGRFWTTRIIAVPDVPPVRRGPYRFMRHPNYVVVAGEIAVLPLAFAATELALAFTLFNGAVLAYRISVENQTLATRAASSPATRAAISQPTRQSAATPR